MKFRTELQLSPSENKISHGDSVFMIGSCFSENISEKLHNCKIPCLSNPSGILYNPISIATSLHHYLLNKKITEKDLFLHNERYHSWNHHSQLSDMNCNTAVENINAATTKAHECLKNATVLIITLGTAKVSRLSEVAEGIAGHIIANNHKAPSDWFVQALLNSQEIKEPWLALFDALEKFNPTLKIIFTVSPVRHAKEGLVENNRSKANLISAVHELVEQNKQVSYFPAYELVIDDLRDYRFYKEDLVHPNDMAVDYVWGKFSLAYFGEDTIALNEKILDLKTAMQHRPFAADSKAHKNFKENYLEKTKLLMAENPEIDFSEALEYFGGKSEV